MTPDCEQFYKKNDPNVFFDCESCLRSYCKTCKTEAHPGVSCENSIKVSKYNLNANDMMKLKIK
jgi:hypothetical protein